MAEPQWLQVDYHCQHCEHDWQEEWSCACDSECPNCGAGDIGASDWEELPSEPCEACDGSGYESGNSGPSCMSCEGHGCHPTGGN